MRWSLTRLYPVIALVVLAGGTIWLERVTRDQDVARTKEERRDPDFIAEETRLTSFDAAGRESYVLLADRITSYPASDITELTRPRLTYDMDGRELRIVAKTGEVLAGGEEVLLKGDVHVHRVPAPGIAELTVATQSLRVWPDDRRAVSNEPVVLTRDASTAHGDGMKADNLFGTLELIGSVRVTMPRSTRKTP